MDFNVNQLVRSAVVLVVGLPVSLAVALAALPEGESRSAKIQSDTKADLTRTCLDYAFSAKDSKAERAAKDAIDERFGEGADYSGVCKWVLG
jgi:hypothetical protein